MADFASQDSVNRVCASLTTFRVPLCRNNGNVDFEASFVSSCGSEISSGLVKNLNTYRKQMLLELASPSNSAVMRMGCVEAYLPYIFNLLDSLNAQPPVTIEKQLSFEWRGAFQSEQITGYSQSNEIIFEMGMVLHTKAILHYMVAQELLQGDVTTNLQVAGQNLKAGAGILKYLAMNLLPKWLAGPAGKGSRPPELTEEVCLAYAELFTASAQQMAYVKAITKVGGTKAGVLTKVGGGVVTLITGNYDPNRILPEHKQHYSVVREFYKGIINKFLAEGHSEKDEKGIAIAYCREALRHLEVQTGKVYEITQVGLPAAGKKGHLAFPLLHTAVAVVKDQIEQLRKDAENDNKVIYFQAIPATADLPEPPAPAIMMLPTEFQPPELPTTGPIIFTYDASRKPSLLTKMSSFKVF